MLRASALQAGDMFLPAWSTDGLYWRPVVMTHSIAENPSEFVHSMLYRTEDEALAVSKRFCEAINPVFTDQARIDAGTRIIAPDTVVYVSGDTTQFKVITPAIVEKLPEVPDDGARDPHG